MCVFHLFKLPLSSNDGYRDTLYQKKKPSLSSINWTYTISFCPKERTWCKQRPQKTDFSNVSLKRSIKDESPCKVSGVHESKRKYMNLQNLRSWFSYLHPKKQLHRKEQSSIMKLMESLTTRGKIAFKQIHR